MPRLWDSIAAGSYRNAIQRADEPNETLDMTGRYASVFKKSISASFTLTADFEPVCLFTPVATQTVTLPPVAGNEGRQFFIKNISVVFSLTLDGSGAETIDNQTTQSLAPLESLHVVCDGTEWWII
jgi:hypothetical protein